MRTCRSIWTANLAIAAALALVATTQAAESARLTAFRQGDQTSYAVSLAPEMANKEVDGVDVVVLFDTSASQQGAYRETALEALKTLVAGLRPTDRVQIVAVDLDARDVTTEFVAGNDAAVAKAIATLGEQAPLGSTDIEAGLTAAISKFDCGEVRESRDPLHRRRRQHGQPARRPDDGSAGREAARRPRPDVELRHWPAGRRGIARRPRQPVGRQLVRRRANRLARRSRRRRRRPRPRGERSQRPSRRQESRRLVARRRRLADQGSDPQRVGPSLPHGVSSVAGRPRHGDRRSHSGRDLEAGRSASRGRRQRWQAGRFRLDRPAGSREQRQRVPGRHRRRRQPRRRPDAADAWGRPASRKSPV